MQPPVGQHAHRASHVRCRPFVQQTQTTVRSGLDSGGCRTPDERDLLGHLRCGARGRMHSTGSGLGVSTNLCRRQNRVFGFSGGAAPQVVSRRSSTCYRVRRDERSRADGWASLSQQKIGPDMEAVGTYRRAAVDRPLRL